MLHNTNFIRHLATSQWMNRVKGGGEGKQLDNFIIVLVAWNYILVHGKQPFDYST